jgi:putative hydrolase of the HAD superfamily
MKAAILLDALGTLLQLEPPAPLLRAQLRERFGVAVTEEESARAIAAEIAYYRVHLDEGRDPASVAELRSRCAEALRDALPGSWDGVSGAALTEALLASLRFEPFAEVAGALAAARARGQRLVVVSNWDASLHDVLARVGLGDLLDAIVTSAEAGARKPSPAIFERALAVAGVSAADAIHVGDTVEEDVAGARSAGIEAVLVRRDGGTGPAGVRTIASLAEL